MTLSYLDAGDSRSVTRDKMNALLQAVGLPPSVNTTQATEYFNTLVLDMLDPPLLPIEHGMIGSIARERINAVMEAVNIMLIPVITGPVGIEGFPIVGMTLKGIKPTYTNYGVETWQWMRDGEEIPGATSEEYEATEDDIGYQLSVRFRVENEFGSDESTSEDTQSVVDKWRRPADWLPLPTSQANRIDLLVAVFEADGNYAGVNVTCPSGFTVDWGDGSTPSSTTSSSATTLEHKYEWDDLDPDTLSSRGYRQALVRIAPRVPGNNITAFYAAPQLTGVNTSYTSAWLDCQINTPSLTSLRIGAGSPNAVSALIERVDIIAIGAITTLAGSDGSQRNTGSAFQNCAALQEVNFPAGSLTALTALGGPNFAGAFYGCLLLRSVVFPEGSLENVTALGSSNLGGAFSGCISLQYVGFPEGSLSLVTSMEAAFENCYSIREIVFPEGSLPNVTNGTSAFMECRSLEHVVFPEGALAELTTVGSATVRTGMFQNCFSLNELVFPEGSLSKLTAGGAGANGASFVRACRRLTYLEFPEGALELFPHFNGLLAENASLRHVKFPEGAFDSATEVSGTFNWCFSLSRIEGCAIPLTFSVANCDLGPEALNEIFEALPTVTSQTITITGNWGVSGCDTSIATGKGWTVTS